MNTADHPLMQAFDELARRRKRVETRVALPLITAGAVFGWVLYAVAREIQLETLGVHIPWVTASVTFLPSVAVGIFLTRKLVPKVVLRRRAEWIEEVARAHGVASQTLSENFAE
ncbi:MAG TPA: hypothetical protein VFA20_00665 [Myxococcaceae bacterium]|nr:hypothetical protein [Myxococcaceae bacterium]